MYSLGDSVPQDGIAVTRFRRRSVTRLAAEISATDEQRLEDLGLGKQERRWLTIREAGR